MRRLDGEIVSKFQGKLQYVQPKYHCQNGDRSTVSAKLGQRL